VHENLGIAKKHKPYKGNDKGNQEKSDPDVIKRHKKDSGVEDKLFDN